MPIYNKVTADGKTLIDLSQDTVTQASHIVSPYIAHLRDGTQVTGTAIVASEPNLQTKTNITPTTSSQTITADLGYDGLSSVQINAMPSGSAATPSTTITANPSISINSSGLITATASASQDVTPSVSAGYVSAGTAGNSSISLTASVTTKAAATITPGTSNQTIAAGTYLTGT